MDDFNEDEEEKKIRANKHGEMPLLDEEAAEFLEKDNEAKGIAAAAGITPFSEEPAQQSEFTTLGYEETESDEGEEEEEEDTVVEVRSPPRKRMSKNRKEKIAAVVKRIRELRKQQKKKKK